MIIKARISFFQILFYVLAAVVLLTSCAIIFPVLYLDYKAFQKETEKVREDYVNNQKSMIKNEVLKVDDYIQYNFTTTETRLKSTIKLRVYEAHAIATNLYNENKNKKNISEIQKMIKDALRPIRFSNGRGYYFATALDGNSILFADHPELEGKNILDMRDTYGKYVIREFIELTKKEKEGFYQYRWTKPNAEGKDFPKIAYVKYFEPLNCYIGTGEYLDDVEKDIQLETLDRIGKIRFGKDGYIFVVNYDGVTLMNGVQPNLIGKYMWEMTDPYGVKVIQEERRVADNPNGDFIYYHWEKPTTKIIAPKVSFVKGFAKWRWMFGAGVYIDEVESVVAQMQKTARANARKSLGITVLVVIIAFTIILFFTFRFSRSIKRQFNIFLSFLQKMEKGGEPVIIEDLRIKEFESLGKTANNMLKTRQETELALLKEKDRVKQYLDIAEVMILVLDKDAHVSLINKKGCKILGCREEDIIGKNWFDTFIPQNNINHIKGIFSSLVTGESELHEHYENKIIRKNGEERIISWYNTAVRDENNKIVGTLSSGEDVTEQRKAEELQHRLEEQLQQAQKMESIGKLAGGVAHDFNNLLSPIIGYADIIKESLPPEYPYQSDLDEIIRASIRARDLIRQLLAFSRKQTLEIKTISLNKVILDLEKMLRRAIRENIKFEILLSPDQCVIEGDVGQIEQIILNLAVNSQDAMTNGGSLIIETSEIDIDKNFAEQHTELKPGKYVMLMMSDTGIGMDKDTLSRIFEPFFTTKELGRGTGLGLSTAYGIIKQHGAHINVYSEPGKGTSFSIYFQASSKIPELENRIRKQDKPAGGNETILVVEDQDQVRQFIVRILENIGYNVLSGHNGESAIDTAEKYAGEIHLLITDVVMPDMNGKQLHEKLVLNRKGIKVLFMSGYSANVISHHGVLEANLNFIQKPFSNKDFMNKIREILDKSDKS